MFSVFSLMTRDLFHDPLLDLDYFTYLLVAFSNGKANYTCTCRLFLV